MNIRMALGKLRRNMGILARDLKILWWELWVAIFVFALGLLLAGALAWKEWRP